MPKKNPRTTLRKNGEHQRTIESQLLADALKAELATHKMTAYSLAAAVNVAHSQVYGVLHGEKNMTAVLALKFGRYFDHDPARWMQLQARVDLAHAMQAHGSDVNAIVPHKDRDR